MISSSHSVSFGSHLIEFCIRRRDRKTLEIAVEPDGSIVVTAPLDASIEAIESRVKKRAGWILRQQRYFGQYLPRTPEKRYVAGETHLYLGRQYRLKISADLKNSVKLARGFISVTSIRPSNPEATRELVEKWLLERAHYKFRERLDVCLLRFSEPEVFRPTGLIVRQLEMRWGSMSPAKRLMLNKRLIQAPVEGIDYVITHELCHIAEPNHGPSFYSLLDRVMPCWSKRKERLEEVMA
ncbi:M48 family metallopeptidase [Neorhizobium galegae]|uniref:M48 family metallopeptidase n=1 Tax=Neorhizobium galegae TaxID=399 RepID=UPI002104755B|nr:SprT family zinc-dependent metalloprotease [Neorhizobium galegae]MCQ1769554.1 M48 family metallopeptidase [Neorhizobium galegae]MCQ1849603.1 M48 family metallopeptidase [Neorhizobium galegae]